jgi:AP-5 complex subunit zeta-1
MSDQEGDWDFYLRILSNSARDSTDPASDPSILQSVRIFCPFIENWLETGIK